ncbi:hypothetical protein [Sphingobium baderi]|uniref:hypothetical protein n=1 Tax=Sphingobium baderi TaxID=1332080 RepID=UPI002B417E0D|nr:hypothetical protein [Sphingobium baderi]WRD78801.1 hypothetical protein QQ987_19140 [Sphingobium baderi]
MSLIRSLMAGAAVAAMGCAIPAQAAPFKAKPTFSKKVRASTPVKKGEHIAPLLLLGVIVGGIAAGAVTVAAVAKSNDKGSPASP